MPLHRVAVIALDQVAPFELGVLCEVFGTERDGFPRYEFSVCTPDGGPVRTRSGFMLTPHADLAPTAEADLVAVPALPVVTPPSGVLRADGGSPAPASEATVPTEVLTALRNAHERGARVLSVCSGAFLLGQAGLLDGRACTTHWMYADELARQFPLARVHPDALYVRDGTVITSAGTAAGIDACLDLIRSEHGTAVATRLARRMVVPPHREGGQTQYVETPVPATPACATLEPLLEWMVANLDQPVTVEDLAARVHMAPRTFARRFRAETGTTPHDWLTGQRVLLARRLLEETDLGVDAVAARAGFGEAAVLRHHFARRLGATPHRYRATFRTRP
jgi:transcriptional regulator GlxA family with amidase domain